MNFYCSTNDFRDVYLAHHGITGMKWGKRNGPPYPLTGSQKSSAERKAEKEADRQKKVERRKDAKTRRTMSDEELNRKIDRLQREQRLKDLIDKDVNKGRNATKDVLASSGKKIAGAVLTGVGIYAVKQVVEKVLGPKAAEAIKLPKK